MAASAIAGVEDGGRSGRAQAGGGHQQYAGEVILPVIPGAGERAAHRVKRLHALPGQIALPGGFEREARHAPGL